MTTRKLQKNKNLGAYFCYVPRVLVDALGLEKGDRLRVTLRKGSIILTPEAAILPGLSASEDVQPFREAANE